MQYTLFERKVDFMMIMSNSGVPCTVLVLSLIVRNIAFKMVVPVSDGKKPLLYVDTFSR